MSIAVQLEKVEKKPQPAVVIPPAPQEQPAAAAEEEWPLRRDRVALLIWVAGALILLLYHVYDALVTLFS